MRHPIIALLLLSLLAGCSGQSAVKQASCDRRNFDEVMLQPGCSGYCAQQPCAVNFRLPDGEATYRVTDGHFVLGEGSGGETLFLGSFWLGSHRFLTTDSSGKQLAIAHLVVSGDPM
jgi:hypothetical protein